MQPQPQMPTLAGVTNAMAYWSRRGQREDVGGWVAGRRESVRPARPAALATARAEARAVRGLLRQQPHDPVPPPATGTAGLRALNRCQVRRRENTATRGPPAPTSHGKGGSPVRSSYSTQPRLKRSAARGRAARALVRGPCTPASTDDDARGGGEVDSRRGRSRPARSRWSVMRLAGRFHPEVAWLDVAVDETAQLVGRRQADAISRPRRRTVVNAGRGVVLQPGTERLASFRQRRGWCENGAVRKLHSRRGRRRRCGQQIDAAILAPLRGSRSTGFGLSSVRTDEDLQGDGPAQKRSSTAWYTRPIAPGTEQAGARGSERSARVRPPHARARRMVASRRHARAAGRPGVGGMKENVLVRRARRRTATATRGSRSAAAARQRLVGCRAWSCIVDNRERRRPWLHTSAHCARWSPTARSRGRAVEALQESLERRIVRTRGQHWGKALSATRVRRRFAGPLYPVTREAW